MNVKSLIALAGVLTIGASALAQTSPAAPAAPKKEEAKKEMKKEEPKKEAAAAGKDIVETAMGTGMHNTLCAALKAAGWVEPLKGKGPFTVFAPTDEAFKKLGKTVDELLLPTNKDKLANILKYHVIQGAAVKSDEVVKMKESSATVQGSKIVIAVKEGKVMLNGAATVIKADVACSNGVIHVIDTVLMPPAAAEKKDDKKDGHGHGGGDHPAPKGK